MIHTVRTRKLYDEFAKQIFNLTWGEVDLDQQLFIYEHVKAFEEYKVLVAGQFLSQAQPLRLYFRDPENQLIEKWYCAGVRPHVIADNMPKAFVWAKREGRPPVSLRLFERFMFIAQENWKAKQVQLHNRDYSFNNRWMYDLWKTKKWSSFDFFSGPVDYYG